MMANGRLLTCLALVAVMATACGGLPTPQGGGGPAQAPQQRKTVVVGIERPIDSLGQFGETDSETKDPVHAGLATKNAATFSEEPWMAEDLPSIERGTWKIFPDGTMETVYRLRPGIKWHDGTPFSARDFVFGREVNLDPKVPYRSRRQVSFMDRIDTPDDRTLVITWNQPYRLANRLSRSELYALPRHILEPIYRAGDYERLENSAYWNREFVGTGPYRVVQFEPGTSLEVTAFDDYFLGRPKIDTLLFRVIDDSNAMLTNVLAGELDVTLRSGISFEGGLVAKAQWESQGSGQVIFTPVNWDWVNLSGLNPYFDDLRVRRAFLHAIDRDEIIRSLFAGQEQLIHVPMSFRRPQYQRVDRVVAKYEYSPQRAEALLQEAGWRRGADGVLANARGERLSIDGRATQGSREEEQVQAATISYWNRVAVEVAINNISRRASQSEDVRNRWPGAAWGSGNIVVEDWFDRYSNVQIPTEANRWIGRNVARWTTPEKEAVLIELETTADQRRWEDLTVEFGRLFSLELPLLPLKTSSDVTIVKRGLNGVQQRYESGGENSRTWNVHLWEKT